MPLWSYEKIKERAKKAKKKLAAIKTYKSDKEPFAGSLGVAISVTRKRKKRMKQMIEELDD